MVKAKAQEYSGMAIASFVLGIISFIGGAFLLLIPTILSVIFGFIGLNNIKQNNNLKGKTLAWWGISLSFFVFLLVLIGIFWVIIRNITLASS